MFNYQECGESFIASGDLSGMQGRIVNLIAATSKIGHALAGKGYGVLANKPRSLEHAVVITDGIVKCKAGAAVSAGDFIVSAASGWAIPATLGVTDVGSAGAVLTNRTIMGRALTAAASGFDFALKLRVQETLVLSA
jgi:hypothetical protein